jgi:hypothetical protein
VVFYLYSLIDLNLVYNDQNLVVYVHYLLDLVDHMVKLLVEFFDPLVYHHLVVEEVVMLHDHHFLVIHLVKILVYSYH